MEKHLEHNYLQHANSGAVKLFSEKCKQADCIETAVLPIPRGVLVLRMLMLAQVLQPPAASSQQPAASSQ